MKHIISLSLKYIRRQKLRTALTFLCVTLSVFILCSVTAYIGSIWQTVTNQVIREEGSYEASISPWLNKIDDKEKALDIIKNHAVVSDYNISLFNDSNSEVIGKLNGNMITCIEFSDGKNTNVLTFINDYSQSGNNELNSRERYGVNLRKIKNEGGIIVPAWLKELGYSEGDTLTFTLSPVTYAIDMDSPFIKEIRQKLLDEFGTSVVRDDEGFDEFEYEERKKAYKGGLIAACKYYGYDFSDIPMTVAESREPVEFTLKINSFNESNIDKEILNISRFDEDNYFFDRFFEKYPEMMRYKSLNAFIRINENIDFDDGMLTLFGDLGFNPKDYYFMDQPSLNNALLLLEFRSVSAIVSSLSFLALGAVVIFFAWLVARFVIDNAFEISSQERSSQFASLRVMGASKSQITALVFTEALFYTIVSVPIGTIVAYILCNTSFMALRQMGFQDFEYKANPYFTIGGIVLCVVAIFISAYTSAMWASRKLSPAEALNFGKPKKKKLRKRKSKIKLSSKQFLRRYTSKNIARSKSRYIISTVTMTFGVMFFTFSLMFGIFFYTNIKGLISNNDDFYLAIDGTYTLEDAQSFRNEELFSRCDIYAEQMFGVEMEKTDFKAFQKLHPYSVELGKYFEIRAVDRYCFDNELAELSGMTYDEFVKSGEAMYFISAFGNYNERVYVEGKGFELLYDKFYKKLDEPLDVFLQYVNLDIKVTSVICSDLGSDSQIILPIDSDIIKDLQPSLYIMAKVNGKENYDEAVKVYNDFIEQY
ncbi:MAG: ABC transporter permease, partial [Ruminococcus sp.]|nr:ABC transporter permease [Ruminococcus sp.]